MITHTSSEPAIRDVRLAIGVTVEYTECACRLWCVRTSYGDVPSCLVPRQSRLILRNVAAYDRMVCPIHMRESQQFPVQVSRSAQCGVYRASGRVCGSCRCDVALSGLNHNFTH